MTIPFQSTTYTARLASTAADIAACQALRHRLFFGGVGRDLDRFDAKCQHLMIENSAGRLVATGRLFVMPSGDLIRQGYAGQFYDLSGLAALDAPMIEVGRFCIRPEVQDIDVLRVAWAAITQIVDANAAQFLFGCTSFAGTDPARYGRVFARLLAQHQGASALSPGAIAPHVVPFHDCDTTGNDPMPPLLRSYLGMGGWVGDHAVVDQTLGTLHVFTCLQVAAIPPHRAQALRTLAQGVALS